MKVTCHKDACIAVLYQVELLIEQLKQRIENMGIS
jgi:hypothetical protein